MAKAITMKGIVRSQSKLAVEDGCSEDLINLRFKDGSWRTSGDGKRVFAIGHTETDVPSSGKIKYEQLYVHTNVYRHLLGVDSDTNILYWFADIDSDGVFSAREPQKICYAPGDLTFVQTGNLLTIIRKLSDTDENGGVYYALFDEKNDKYKIASIDQNGNQDERGLYPYGRVHFNLDSTEGGDHQITKGFGEAQNMGVYLDGNECTAAGWTYYQEPDNWKAALTEAIAKAKEANVFTMPFLATLAVKLYDGKYAFASNPVLLWPSEVRSRMESVLGTLPNTETEYTTDAYKKGAYMVSGYAAGVNDYRKFDIFLKYNGSIEKASAYDVYKNKPSIILSANGISHAIGSSAAGLTCTTSTPIQYQINGSDLVLSISDISNILANKELFTGVGIFITRPFDYIDRDNCYILRKYENLNTEVVGHRWTKLNYAYHLGLVDDSDVIYNLTTSPFKLLREYDLTELAAMEGGAIKVDLSDPKYDDVLTNIDEQDTLELETMERKTYVPKCAYNYNGRLHLANYKSTEFHGFSSDCFMFNNHAVSLSTDVSQTYLGIPKLIDENGATASAVGKHQRYAGHYGFNADSVALSQYQDKINSFIAIAVHVETSNGNMKVVRYVEPYKPSASDEYPSFLEKLSPILTYPDNRAKVMDIFVNLVVHDSGTNTDKVTQYKMSIDLKPMPNLNMAYAFKSDLHEYDFTTSTDWKTGTWSSQTKVLTASDIWKEDLSEEGATESVPNGVKVSDALNPLVFPYDNTYQVGSSEIIGLCSNAVAVGTGQTGASPLFVFAKDGVYALMVDQSGELAYSNSRIIARDICNNAKSITPIDGGIVFTSSRGLMSISGQEVLEIGGNAEGEPFDYNETSSETSQVVPNSLGHNILVKIAELPPIDNSEESESVSESESEVTEYALCDNVDFLDYIKGAIVNYNYNLRELYITNPSRHTSGSRQGEHIYDYSYVLDRNGNWSRRILPTDEYINNYPTSYRYEDGTLFQIDKDGNANDEADNKFFALSNVIKLDTLNFKKAFRFIARGFFHTYDKENGHWTIIPEEEDTEHTISAIAIAANNPASGNYTAKSWSLQNVEMEVSGSTPVSHTFTIPTGDIGVLTIVYGGSLAFTLNTTSGVKTILDSSGRNEMAVRYVVKNADGENVFTSDKFVSSVDSNGKFRVDLDSPNDIVSLKAGTYSLHLIMESLDMNLTSDAQPTVVTKNITATEGTVLISNDQTESGTSVLQSDTATIGTNGGKIDMTFSGYTDFVCGNVGSTTTKICQFDTSYSNSVKLQYCIYDSSNNQVFIKEFIGEQLDDYTIRVYLSYHSSYEESESESSSESSEELTSQTASVELGTGTYTLKLQRVLDVKLSNLTSETSTDSYTLQRTSSQTSSFYRTPESGYVTISGWADELASGVFGKVTIPAQESKYKACSVSLESTEISTAMEDFEFCQLVLKIVGAQSGDVKFESTGRDMSYITLWDNTTNTEVNGTLSRFFPLNTYTSDATGVAGTAKWGVRFGANTTHSYASNLLNPTHQYCLRLHIALQISSESTISLEFDAIGVSTNNKIDVTYAKEIQYKFNEVNTGSSSWTQRSITNLCTSNKVDIISYTAANNITVNNTFSLYIPESRTWTEGDAKNTYVGLYLLGSNDGRKWMLLGGNEKHGKFTDIGCLTERTDVKYLRYAFAGNVKGDSRLDYFEIEGDESNLSTKIR